MFRKKGRIGKPAPMLGGLVALRGTRGWKWLLKILGGVGLLLASGACQTDTSTQARKDLDMTNICQIPEDEAALRSYILERVGGEITNAAVTQLQEQFTLEMDKTGYDLFQSDLTQTFEKAIQALSNLAFDLSTFNPIERVRIVRLQKHCTAPDGVGYDLEIGATIGKSGRGIFRQFLVRYAYEDILAGRRPFSFDRFRGSNEQYAALIAARTAGFTRLQLDEYMATLGCTRRALPSYLAHYSTEYYYDIDPRQDLLSRTTIKTFSKRIVVETHADDTVYHVSVHWTPYEPERSDHDRNNRTGSTASSQGSTGKTRSLSRGDAGGDVGLGLRNGRGVVPAGASRRIYT